MLMGLQTSIIFEINVLHFPLYFMYQVCFVVAVNVIGQRMDICALLHSFALMAVLARRRRKAIGEVWPKYCCFIASFMVLQYLLCIGLPPALCIGQLLNITTAKYTCKKGIHLFAGLLLRNLMFRELNLHTNKCTM